MSSSLSGPAEASKPKLLDQIRQLMRLRHYSLRTEEAYVGWIRRYILFHGKQHPRDLAGSDIASFLSSLAIKGQVAASTHFTPERRGRFHSTPATMQTDLLRSLSQSS